MSFLHPTQPLRRFGGSVCFGLAWLGLMWALWLLPVGMSVRHGQRHVLTTKGVFWAYVRDDLWQDIPHSRAEQISQPTFSAGPGLTITVLVSTGITLALGVLYARFIQQHSRPGHC